MINRVITVDRIHIMLALHLSVWIYLICRSCTVRSVSLFSYFPYFHDDKGEKCCSTSVADRSRCASTALSSADSAGALPFIS